MITLMLKLNHVISQHAWILLQMTNTLPSCVISYSHNQTLFCESTVQDYHTDHTSIIHKYLSKRTNLPSNKSPTPRKNHRPKKKEAISLGRFKHSHNSIKYGLYGIFTGPPHLLFKTIIVAEFFPHIKALSILRSPRRLAERKNLDRWRSREFRVVSPWTRPFFWWLATY